MAGRGTDIKLGEGVKELGGLCVIGTERHESRRIDNQLRGRSGRQGDPGVTQFYLSMEDELMRRFGSDNMKSMMERLGMDDTQPIQSKMVSRAVESAQNALRATTSMPVSSFFLTMMFFVSSVRFFMVSETKFWSLRT